MPVLIDGNNLLFAARELDDPDRPPGRALLCNVLAAWAARTGETLQIVFDGPRPSAGFAAQIERGLLDVEYSGSSSADAVLIERLESDSAALHLTFVSSDRAIQRVAKRRRAKVLASDVFWRQVRRDLARPPNHVPQEPPEKQQGLTAAQTDEWLDEFGLDARD